MSDDQHYMLLALHQARLAAQSGEVPVGAVVVCDGQVLAATHNNPVASNNPCAHAEIRALTLAAECLENYRLINCDLYVTLEPCLMCFGAMVHARIKRIIFGAHEPKAGVLGSQLQANDYCFLNHKLEIVSGVMAQESSALLRDFFTQRRQASRKRDHRVSMIGDA